MRIIYTYLFKEIAIVAVATTAVLTFLLVLVNAFKDIFDLLLHDEVSLWVICQLVGLLIPFALTFTLPWGLLLAVLLVFGRFSQDKELLTLKASGIGLLPIIAPALWLGVIFSIISFVNNATIAPQCRKAFKEISIDLIRNNPMAFFTPQTTIEKFPGMRIWVGSKKGTTLEDVHIWRLNENMVPINSIRADSARLDFDMPNERIVLALHNARQEERSGGDVSDVNTIHPGAHAQELPMTISLSDFFQRDQKPRSDRLTLGELRSFVTHPMQLRNENPVPFLTELQKRIALSISCLTFVLVGVPLAIQTQRRETSVGVVMSLGIVLAYYFITVLAEVFKRNAGVYPEVIIWLPNFIFQTVGAFLIARANFR
jgi:lipopolysaccharide export system permease protein